MAAAAAAQPSIFDVIEQEDLEEVQRRVRADPSVLEERRVGGEETPLMWAIREQQPAIALWLIEHRGNHDLDAKDDDGWSAIHYACQYWPLEVVQQLVAAGADVRAVSETRFTALMMAASDGLAQVAAFLLTLPAVREGIDSINAYGETALSRACSFGRAPIVRLLLDAGANPTIPPGEESPLSHATNNNHPAIIPLLNHAIAEPQRPRLLHKARSLVDATHTIRKAQHDSAGRTRGEVRRKVIAAAPEYLRGRVAQGSKPLPHVQVNEEDEQKEEEERRQAMLAYVLGLAYGEKGAGLPGDVFVELLELMVPRWDTGARRPPA